MKLAAFRDIQACVFDAYGTLFDVHSAVASHAPRLGDRVEAVSALWRGKQLEYTWLRSLMGLHADFWQVTGEALDFALATHGVEDSDLRRSLLDAYLELKPYPEVRATLEALAARGYRLAILSNGTPTMLVAALANAGFDDLEITSLSVEEVGIYKPDPRVYQLACERLELPADRISFQSSNAWDAAGAAAFGMRVAWINRFGQRRENLPYGPSAEIRRLDELLELIGG